MKYDYTAYGLSFRSDVFLPGLWPDAASAASGSITFSAGTKPTWVAEAAALASEVIHFLPEAPECADPAFLVREFGSGRFYQLAYSDGTQFFLDSAATTIWGNCPSPLTMEDLTTYLLGPVMGFVLRRREVTPLHASAVCFGGAAIAICGPAAAGKSTTAGALALRGANVLCEDIAALKEEEGRFYVQPGYPRVCLWPDSVEKLLGSAGALPRLTPNWEKHFLGLDGGRANFEAKPKPLGAIYLLGHRSEEESAPRIDEITPREALLDLVQNTYMNLLLTREQRAAEFEMLSRLVNVVPCRRVIPHANAARIGALCEVLEADAKRIGVEALSAMPSRSA